jgi:sugar lactone lactonase YvrE
MEPSTFRAVSKLMRFAGLLLILIAATTAIAHPPVAIVIDGQGNIYYSDLTQVLRRAPDGKLTTAVPNVHTHELALDAAGNLYGEHLRYSGEATNRWYHYFWRRSPDGTVTRLMPEHEPFKNEDAISLVRDAAGNSYWANREQKSVMRNGAVLARAEFKDIRWMTATPNGTVYLIDSLDLIRITPKGEVTTVARKLADTRLLRPDIERRHVLMGLWTDRPGNIYVADFANGKVKRVAPDGRVTVVAESTLPWAVTGGAFAPNGDLWLLETSMTNSVRVRKVVPKAK